MNEAEQSAPWLSHSQSDNKPALSIRWNIAARPATVLIVALVYTQPQSQLQHLFHFVCVFFNSQLKSGTFLETGHPNQGLSKTGMSGHFTFIALLCLYSHSYKLLKLKPFNFLAY